MSKEKPSRFRGDLWFRKQVENHMWDELKELQARGKVPKGSLESLRGTAIYKLKFNQHAKLVQEEWKLQEPKRTIQKREEALKAQAENEALLERDKAWAEKHANDSDDELLDYVRHCAAELGHTPMRREVLGSTYIAKRFGNWAVALTVAELPLPKSIKAPKQTALDAYWKSVEKRS